MYLVILVYIIAYSLLSKCGASRVKRVISGDTVLDMNPDFHSLWYFVWMGYGHSCDVLSQDIVRKLVEIEWKFNRSFTIPFTSCAPNVVENLRCGGSLLTVTIVQTSCHCITEFGGEKDGFSMVVPLLVWENMFDIYPGVEPAEKAKGVKARDYIRHPKCTQHFDTETMFYDYALVVLRDPLLQRRIRYAPAYTIQSLAKLWTDIMAKRMVCLYMGFGSYRLKEDNWPEPTRSKVLLHGWGRVMSFLECMDLMDLPNDYSGTRYNYSDATWFCNDRLPSKNDFQSDGDSGGPMSCNNHYAGILTLTSHITENFAYYYSVQMSTAFSVFENSVEYREALIILVHLYSKFDAKAKLFNYKPTGPQIHQYYEKLPDAP